MSAYTLVPGATGPDGTGLSLLTWRNVLALNSGDTAGVPRYLEVYGARVANAGPSSISGGRVPFKSPRAGTLRDFCCKFSLAPAVSTQFLVYVNGVATGITVTASGTTPVFDATHTAAVVQGDLVQVGASFTTGTPSNTSTIPQAIITLV